MDGKNARAKAVAQTPRKVPRRREARESGGTPTPGVFLENIETSRVTGKRVQNVENE
jgi:hypothetical protein